MVWEQAFSRPVHVSGTDGVVEAVVGDRVGVGALPVVFLLGRFLDGACHLDSREKSDQSRNSLPEKILS